MERRYVQIIFGLLFLGIVFLSSCNGRKTVYYRNTEYPRLLEVVEDGDIILRKGSGVVSAMIVARLNDTVPFSHCGIIIRDSTCCGDSSVRVIHSLSPKITDHDGMQECTLKEFLFESVYNTICVVRFKKDTAGVIGAAARDYLSAKVPFDDKYSLRDTSAFFCSELPIRIITTRFGTAVTDLNSESIPKFSIFLNGEYFTKVY